MPYKTLGYVVTNARSYPMLEVDGILYHGNPSTLFASYDRARRAVKRTQLYAAKRGLPWEQKHEIHRVVAEEEKDRA